MIIVISSIVGSILIIVGLYAILWAKDYERQRKVLKLVVSDRENAINPDT